MGEHNTGLRRLLRLSYVYSGFQWAVGARNYRRFFIEHFIQPSPGRSILDIGCGTGEIIEYLSGMSYTGCDHNPRYIELATKRYGQRGRFHCTRAGMMSAEMLETYDVVSAMSLLHHLDDEEARALLDLARKVLNPGGRFVAIDTCYSDDQPPLCRWMVGRDRGQNVRHVARYTDMVREFFPRVETEVRHDLLRIPYSFCAVRAH